MHSNQPDSSSEQIGQTDAKIGVVMCSSSDWDTMQHAVAILQHFVVAHEAQVLSAHRMPDQMFAYAEAAADLAATGTTKLPIDFLRIGRLLAARGKK